MTAEKSTPCGFSAVLLLRRRAVVRYGPPARGAQVSLAWAACLPRLALAPWRERDRLLSGPFSTMVGPYVLNGPFLVTFRACFGPLSTKVGETCKTDHFERPTQFSPPLLASVSEAIGRAVNGLHPRLLHGVGGSGKNDSSWSHQPRATRKSPRCLPFAIFPPDTCAGETP